MKKILLIAAIAVCGMFSANAQDVNFGVKAGYLNASGEIEFEGVSVSSSESGFYLGALVDLGISDNFHVQPELLYGNAGEGSFLFIPVLAKYYIAESGFSIMAGPQGTLDLEDGGEGYNSFGIDVAFGVAYDINENFFVDARYSLELTNRFSDGGDDFSGHINTFQIGLGYKF